MKQLALLVILIFAAQLCAIDTPAWAWAESYGGSGLDYADALALDRYGCSYVCGGFSGSANFGGITLTDTSDGCLYVAKFDAEGECVWANKPSGNVGSEAYAIATDGSQNSYITGFYTETVTFGSTTLNCTESGVFVAKLSPAGNWLWAVQPGMTGWVNAYGIACDLVGGIYLSGNFTNTATFGSETLTSAGQSDVFAAKLDTEGNWIWARRAGGTNWEESLGIAVKSMGSCVISGQFNDSASFGSTTLTSSGGSDAFVASLSTTGVWQWAKKAGGTNFDACRSVCLDFDDNVCVTGVFSGSAAFGATTLSSVGSTDLYVAKLDPAGNWLWAVNPATGNWAEGKDVCVNRASEIFITGNIAGTNGIPTLLAAKVDTDGDWLWTMDMPSNLGERCGYGIGSDGDGNVLLAGNFSDSEYFAGTTLTSAGWTDGFLAKITNLDSPELSIETAGGHPVLGWQEYGAPDVLVHVYGHSNPYATSHWNLLGSTYERTFDYTGPESCLFFKATAEQVPPAQP